MIIKKELNDYFLFEHYYVGVTDFTSMLIMHFPGRNYVM